MKTKYKSQNLQDIREEYIELLAEAGDKKDEKEKELANDLYSLDLTTYSGNHSFDSILYNFFAKSYLDENISLHPEQLQIVNEIKKNDALILSAPTSFGKTFSIFEYIARESPKNIFLIVPTLALVDEYMRKIIKEYRHFFQKYRVHTQLQPDSKYDASQFNIFILTHDRVIKDDTYKIIKDIDLLVIDEVYKLKTDIKNDRVLVLNMAYLRLSKIAKKYVLLAPFIKGIEDLTLLEKKPIFYRTDYSPVVNKVIIKEISSHEERLLQCDKLLKEEIDSNEKTLIYFPTVTKSYDYIEKYISKDAKISNLSKDVSNFISWAKDEIHEDWCVIKALERGYSVHNGQIPIGVRSFLLNLYENNDNKYNRLLCTSTLLEGVNTSAKNIIITFPSRQSMYNKNEDFFTSFDFFNLVGRTGRLNKHFIGNAYYLKEPSNENYSKKDAFKSIKFELTDNSIDIDIQTGNISDRPEFTSFLDRLGIDYDRYLKNIGCYHFRFPTIKELYDNFKGFENKLRSELIELSCNKKKGRRPLIKILYKICKEKDSSFYDSMIINELLHMLRPSIKNIIEKIKNNFKECYEKYSDYCKKIIDKTDINTLISRVIKMKSSYIPYTFYNKVKVIRFFMTLDKSFEQFMLNILDEKVLTPIDSLYFSNSKQRKMLFDIGIYERDIEKIINIIGEDFNDINEMKEKIVENKHKFNDLCFISKCIIRNYLN